MKKGIITVCLLIIMILIIYFFKDYNINNEINESIQYKNNVEKYVKNYVERVLEEDDSYELIKTMCVLSRTCYMYEKTMLEDQMKENDWNDIFIKENKQNKHITKKMKSKISKAEVDTKGEIMVYQDNIIYPFFHYVSPRVTRNKDMTLGITVPYLKEKRCTGDINSKEFIQIKYFNKNDLKKILSLNNDNIKGNLKITQSDEYGYVSGIKIDDKYVVDVYEIVSKLGLNSTNFTISTYAENDNIVRFVCRGKGSGMGLSIFDANRLANKGMKYKDIINMYYKDIEIKKYVF